MSDGYAPAPRPFPASGRGGERDAPQGDSDFPCAEAHERSYAQPDRIAWRCRRGLLELDLLLGGFWAAHRATLAPDETAALERLLALPDMEIVDRIEGRAPAGDDAVADLVERLKNYRDTAG
ncbi:MAG: succinate dehydrogenase assembly factor 2 [Gammaproteobacteria bacterium]